MENLFQNISLYWQNGKNGKFIIILILVVVLILICICCVAVAVTAYQIGSSPSAIATEEEDSFSITSNPCENLGDKYVHDEELGEIIEDFTGSWHASPSVGAGYSERFVFFSSGNYLFFPSQYECDNGDEACIPSPIEEGIWGVQDSQINLAIEGRINNVRSILIGKVSDSPDGESPYFFKTTFDGTTYWLISKDTNMWNPLTGEPCY